MNDIPKGPGAEQTNGEANLPGVYKHPVSGVEVISSPGSTGLNEGGTQADALVRVGFKRVGPVPSREDLLAMNQAQLAKDTAPVEESPKKDK